MQVKKHTAIVYRAYPNHEQRELIERTIGCARFVYNQMLADRIEHYKQTEELLRNTPAQYKDRFPFLREVDSMALCNAQLNLNRAYSRFFKDPQHVGFPKFKAKHKAKSSYTTNCIKGNIRLEDSGRYLRLPKLGRVRVRQHKTIPADWKLKSVTVEHTRSGKYTMTVLFEYESQIPEPHTPERFVGLDYSSHDLYVSSDGLTPDYPRFYRQAEQRLAREQRRLSHMQKQSNNWCKQKTKVARLHERVRNMRRDFLHKTANMLVEQYDCVCVEDLNLQAVSQSLELGKSTMDNGFGLLRNMLSYKLEQNGGRMVKIDRFYPSSQLCHDCEYKNTATKNLSVREWDCPQCGAHHDRDVNAALNIRDEGKRLVS